ncbi:Fatty acid desaturase [Geosmithia morbida]|uniref:Fatty acid desaturase n=1 Tax=Geosmithia morbida TaxID=1094350 RepID=A0A9P4Z165_9HYPO|nr:Fatty acid desaturase [Geosmithia morbida]KAF4124739.1 Fatty acid desaturase [Geosmithia morbida]
MAPKSSMVSGGKLPRADREFPDINTLKQAIPKHCFQPPALRSMWYLVRDVIMALSLGWAAVRFIPEIPSPAGRAAAWIIYGFVQGLVCTGIWILGHEGGHGAFSMYPKLNDAVGFFAHSVLLVPYFSWKFSHHRHHRYTGHMEKDMVFVPRTRTEYLKSKFRVEYLEDTPAYQAIKLLFHQTLGWGSYLFINSTAGPDSLQRPSKSLFDLSHFDPTSAVFRRSEGPYILLSDLGIAMTFGALYILSRYVGTSTTVLLYAQAYFWVHHWLVAITYLHHTHVEVPHYDRENWTYVKGALATVDREFGFVGRHLFHGIIEHHVIHHLFPRIPFYYAEEATDAIKPILGDLYYRDDRNFLGQLWSNFTSLKFVEPDMSASPGVLKWATKTD